MSSLYLMEISDLSVTFSTKVCFSEFSTRVYTGERIAIVGDNGSGKSTLIKALLGDIAESNGTVTFCDGVKVASLPQDPTVDEYATVWESLSEPVSLLFEDLKQLELLAETLADNPDVATQYEIVLERIIAADGFALENRLEALLEEVRLLKYRDLPISQLSGGERMRLGWARLLAPEPDILFLDEPTNHLDRENRQLFFDFLDRWKGAAIVVSHDVDFLSHWGSKVWHLESGAVHVFDGSYQAFCQEHALAVEKERLYFEELKQQRRQLVAACQQEDTRRARTAAQTKKRYANEPLILNSKRGAAENSKGHQHIKKRYEDKERVKSELREIRKPRRSVARFHFENESRKQGFYLEVIDGAIGYGKEAIVTGINLRVRAGERIAIAGANGSGKTTLMRALMDDKEISRTGEWQLPADIQCRVGYLDQHYKLLDRELTVDQAILQVRPEWSWEERARHLNAFLFVHHRSLKQKVGSISEGEKVRLSLAVLAARAPEMLILDEVTNNLDVTTKEHLTEILKSYSGTLLVNSHEDAFLNAIGIETVVKI